MDESHATHAGHDEEGEALGPFDLPAWVASAAGVAIGLVTAAVFWLATRGGP